MEEKLTCDNRVFGMGRMWCFQTGFATWVGQYFITSLDEDLTWVVISRYGMPSDVKKRPIEAGPFATLDEAKAVITAMHRMNK